MANYCARGRIRTLIIFDRKHVSLRELCEEYESFFDALNRDREELLNVEAFVNAKQPVPDCFAPKPGLVLRHAPGLDTFWTQDAYVFRQPGLLLMHDKREEKLRRISEALTGHHDIQVVSWPQDIDGGNLLQGKVGGTQYLLAGIGTAASAFSPARPVDLEALRIEFSGARVVPLLDDSFAAYHPLFYHADVYCTIAGETDEGKELIFFAQLECMNAVNLNAAMINAKLRERAAIIRSQLDESGNKVQIAYLPMLVLNYIDQHEHNDAEFNMIISFNNLLIENYREPITGKHIRRAYIPDYSHALKNYFMRLEETGREDLLARSYWNTQTLQFSREPSTSRLSAAPSQHRLSSEIMRTAVSHVVERKTAEVELLLKRHGFSVMRIGMNQYRTLRETGAAALHCRAKVIERDCLD